MSKIKLYEEKNLQEVTWKIGGERLLSAILTHEKHINSSATLSKLLNEYRQAGALRR